MKLDRRTFIGALGAGALTTHGGLGKGSTAAQSTVKVGMCDWNLGTACDPEMIPKAAEAGLQGIQVSVGTSPDHLALRDPLVRRRYIDLGKQHGIAFNSVAAGGILNRIPLMSEPQSAIYVVDALEAAAALGAQNILIAFFGNGDLRLRDSEGEFRNVSDGPFASFELDSRGVNRVVDALKQLLPRAEDLQVILGLENTLTADQNLEIMDRLASKMVQVYYDLGNSTHYGYDVPAEIRRLGRERICEIHLKDWKTPLLGSGEGEVDFAAAAEACRTIGFDQWYVLESSGREGKFLEDTRANIAFAQRLLG